MLNRIAEYAKPENFAANTDIAPLVFFATDQSLEIICGRRHVAPSDGESESLPSIGG